MSSNDAHDVKPMVSNYKKLFLVLSVITLIGIAVAILHVPVWVIFVVGFVFITLKTFIVFEAFKKFLVGRNLIVMVFIFTILCLIGLLVLPVLNHYGYLVGTEDISKQFLMEQKDEGSKHGH